MRLTDLPDSLLAYCLSFLGHGDNTLLLAAKSLILSCKELKQRMQTTVSPQIQDILKTHHGRKIAAIWGDLSYFQRGSDHYHGMVRICDLHHCGFVVDSMRLRFNRGDMPLLNILLQNDYLPTWSLTSLDLLPEWNGTIPLYMFPHSTPSDRRMEDCKDTDSRHFMIRFLSRYLAEQTGSAMQLDQFYQNKFGRIQSIHSTLATKCPNLQSLKTVFVWDSTCWKESQIQEFLSLSGTIRSLQLTFIPEVTLRRGDLDPQTGRPKRPSSSEHCDVKMLRILERILGSFPNLEQLILRSHPDLYAQIIVENTAPESWIFQSDSLTYLNIVGLDGCYMFEMAICPHLQQFRYKQEQWNENENIPNDLAAAAPHETATPSSSTWLTRREFVSPKGDVSFELQTPAGCMVEEYL